MTVSEEDPVAAPEPLPEQTTDQRDPAAEAPASSQPRARSRLNLFVIFIGVLLAIVLQAAIPTSSLFPTPNPGAVNGNATINQEPGEMKETSLANATIETVSTVTEGNTSTVPDKEAKSEAEGAKKENSLKYSLADAVPNLGDAHGCRQFEHTVATVTRHKDTNVSLRSLQIGNEIIHPKGCIAGGWYSSTEMKPRCTNLIVFKEAQYLVTQDIGADGLDVWTIEGLVECNGYLDYDNKHDVMRKHSAGHHRGLEFNFSGNADSAAARVHIVSHQGGVLMFDDQLPVTHGRKNTHAKFNVIPELNKLLQMSGGVYEVDPECEPEVQTALLPYLNGSSAQLILTASVPNLCDLPPITVLNPPGGSYFVRNQTILDDEKVMREFGITDLMGASRAFVAYSIQLGLPAGRDVPSVMELPIQVKGALYLAKVETCQLWQSASNLHINVVGPIAAGKSSTCGLLYCFFSLSVLDRDRINECLLHTNPFERGQNSQFTHTTRRLTWKSESGVSISDNPGTDQINVAGTAAAPLSDMVPDAISLDRELNGLCSGDCSPGECRRQDIKCNPADVQCPDVDLVLVPVASLDSKEAVGGLNHPLFNEYKRVARLQEGTTHCKHPAVIVVQVKHVADETINAHSPLYSEAERELCRKARSALHANEGTPCVSMSLRVPQEDITDEWLGKYLGSIRNLHKKLEGAKKKASDTKNRGRI